MKKQTNKTNWWIDLTLFIGFILAFLLEITGLSLHQWGGLFICILAIYHLLRHRKWIVNILKRFYVQNAGGQRLRFVIDLLLLFGFEIILLTGLLISSWFDLPVNNYLLLRNIHVIASIGSLVLLFVKIALHVHWINSTAQKIFHPSSRYSVPQTTLETAPLAYSKERREALRLMGTVGIASFTAILIGGSKTLQSLLEEDQIVNAQAVSTTASTPTSTPGNTPTATATPTSSTELADPQVHNKRRNRGQSESTPTPTSTATQEYTSPQLTATPTPTSTPTASSCIIRCPKGCAYPGSCRRYIDANGNGLCDLGECL